MPIRSTRADAIRNRLLDWWDAGHRALPWRFPQHAADPYRVWISEVMLQQTQVAVVLPYYRRFVQRFPTLTALARASEDEVLAAWSGLGYYARGRRLLAAAREATARYGGLPRSAAELATLPGFGRYTAGAVASIAFALPVPCVDGNVARVLARLFLVEGSPDERHTAEALWSLAAALVSPDRPGDLNQALMELGATVCAKGTPACERCPVAMVCAARRGGRQREIPPPRSRAAPRPVEVACAVVHHRGALLVVRRPAEGLFGGLWELPSVVVAPGADARAELRSGAREQFQLGLRPGEALASVDRSLSHRRLRLTAYRCRARLLPPAGATVRFATPAELRRAGVSTAMRRLIEALQMPLTRKGVTV